MADGTRVTNLLIEEVSAVDDPANELLGWAVQKRKQDARVEAILKQVDAAGMILRINDAFVAEELDADAIGKLATKMLQLLATIDVDTKKDLLTELHPDVRTILHEGFRRISQ